MKILISKVGHEFDLQDELTERGLVALLPLQVRKVRVSRKSNKVIEKQFLVVRRMLFCEIEDTQGLRWLHSAWTKDGKWVEVSAKEVQTFIECIASPEMMQKPQITGMVGDVIRMPSGIFEGQLVKVLWRKGNKIKGMLMVDGQEHLPIDVVVDKI